MSSIEEPINWTIIIVLGLIFILAYFNKITKKSKTLGKLGLNTNNLLLMSNFKNALNYMPDEKQKIYQELIHGIIMAQDKTEEIIALEEAIKKIR